MEVFNRYENINIFLDRDPENAYNNSGRIHTEKESENISKQLKKYLKKNGIKYETIIANKKTAKVIYKKFFKN